jgi:sensor domain CHASE-containing protein
LTPFPATSLLLLPTSRSRRLVAAIGFLCAALGVAVLIGWHADLPALLQLRPTLAPMQYNTALCFLLAGAGLGALVWGRVRWAQVLAGVVGTVAALTVCEYLFEADFGIDQLLFQPYIATQTSHPGRMSPVTAVCFSQVGLALLLTGFRFGEKWRIAVIGSLGSIVMAICVMAILGYATGLPGTSGWGQLTRMTPHAASGLGLLGAGIFALAWTAPREEGQRTPRWLPLPVGLSIFAASVVLWQALENNQQEQIAQTVRAGAESAANQIQIRIEERIHSLQRMARRWEFSGRPSQAAWEADARAHVQDFPDLQALTWVDAAHLDRWIVPLQGNEGKLGLDLTQEERRRRAVESAKQLRQPVITGTVTLFRGGLGYIIYVPIFVGPEFDGFLKAVFEAQPAIDRYLPPAVASGESIRLSHGGQPFFERSPGPLPALPEWIVDSRIELPGVTWDVRVWPNPALIARLDSHLPRIALVIGTIGSLLLALTTFLAQLASSETRKIATEHSALVAAQAEVKVMSGLLPICAECKRIKDDEGHWTWMENYVSERSGASFSHGLCPLCAVEAYQREGFKVPASRQAEVDEGKFDR